MENGIVILVLLAVIAVAVGHFRKHFSGGGCCGSAGTAIRREKTLAEPPIGEVVFCVEGMHCENCQARIENALNSLEGVACRVDLREKTVTVTYSRPVPQEELHRRIENLGYPATPLQ